MKKVFLFLSSLLIVHCIIAQDSKVSATLSYPLPIGDNSLGSYTGVVDVGLQVRFINAGPIKIGLSANAGYFSRSNELDPAITIKGRVYLIQPRVFAELQLESLTKLKPFAGLGYSLNLLDIEYEDAQNPPDYDDSTGGINVNIGAAYDFTNRFFALVQFDFLKVSRDNPNQNNDFFRNSNILKVGLGLRF